MGPGKPTAATDVVAEVQQVVETRGVAALTIDDLTTSDLARIPWVSELHRASMAKALARVDSGQVDYLAIRAPDGRPIAKAGIDYTAHPGAATLWQLATHPQLQSLGLGTALVEAAEDRSRRRGVHTVVLGVEDNNPRARALYERLGYRAFGTEPASWWQTGPAGQPELYETEVTLLRKQLPA